MDVQVIDREPKGTGAEFDVGSGASLSGTLATVSAVPGFFDVQPLYTVVRIVSQVTVRSLSATPTPNRSFSRNAVEHEFMVLASRWRRQTGMLSSSTEKTAHPDYLQIIAKGKQSLPFILRELRDHGGHWYEALEAITGGVNPIPPGAEGYIPQMKAAWLDWGRKMGLVQ